MNLKKVIISSLSVFALLSSATGSVLASEQNQQIQENAQYQSLDVSSKNAILLENLELLGEYIIFGEDGLFHIDKELKKVVNKETYDIIEEHNEKINQLIKSGDLSLDENGNFKKPEKTKKNNAQYYEDYTYHWWGTHYILNREQADNLANDLEDSADTYQFIAIAAALTPEGVGSKVTAGIAQVIAMHHDNISEDIDDEKTEDGVYLDLDWSEWFYNVYGR